jgi:hypothetical protein
MGWLGAFPQVISAGATGWTQEWSEPTGSWVVQDVLERNATRGKVRESSGERQPLDRTLRRPAQRVGAAGLKLPGTEIRDKSRARLFQARPRLLRRVWGGIAGRRGGLYIAPGAGAVNRIASFRDNTFQSCLPNGARDRLCRARQLGIVTHLRTGEELLQSPFPFGKGASLPVLAFESRRSNA